MVGEGLNPLMDFFGAEIASAEDGRDFVGGDHVFVLGGNFGTPLGNVEVAKDQGELSHLLLFGHSEWL